MLRTVLALWFFGVSVLAQSAADLPVRQPDGGGPVFHSQEACLTPTQYAEIHALLKNQRQKLRDEGKLSFKDDAPRPLLTSPLATHDQVKGYNPWGIINYVDQNGAFPDKTLDYNGGQRTYDLESGYNHRGIDYTMWPFKWDIMAKREVAVVAAAPGTIVYKKDGESDMNCGSLNGSQWNAVYVEHDDGSTAWYGHLAVNTQTPKAIGERVARGEFLGYVGSSGSSTAPHLHFELYDRDGKLNDPFAGPYNFLNQESWWEEQEPYQNSYIAKMYSHSDVPVIGNCPEEEMPHFKNHFEKGEQANLAVYYRDQLGAHITTYSIIDPNGVILGKWTHSPPGAHFATVWWYWSFTANDSNPDGVYLWQASYLDKVTQHAFGVGDIGEPIFDAVNQDRTVIAPGQTVTVSWETSGVLELYLNQGYGNQPVDGSVTLKPTQSTTYVLTGKGLEDEVQYSFEVEVLARGDARMVPHVTPDNTAFITDFILANPTAGPLSYEFQPYNSAGNALDVVAGVLPANATQHLTKNALFGTAPVSHFAISADAPLAVSASYRAAAGGSPAHLTDAAVQATGWRVYTGNWDIIWDGMAVVNRGNSPTEVFVTQVDAAGNEVQTVSLGMVAPNAKALAVLASLGFVNTPGTHFRVHGEQLLAITALRGQLNDALYLWENKAIPE